MRFLLLLTVAAEGCFSTPPPPSPGHHRTIEIEQPPDTALTGFPVAVWIDGDPSLSESATSAQHIAFELPGGEPIPCEIVAFDSSTGALEAWAQLPTLSTSERTFVLVYGQEVTPSCTASAMWPMNEYRAVWHLSDVAPATVVDSTANHHTLTAGVDTAPTQAPGIFGGSIRFDDGDANGADKVCSAAPGLDFGTDSFSYELWVKQDVYRGMYDVALANGGKGVLQAGYDVELGSDDWDAYLRDGSDPYDRLKFTNDGTLVVNSWHQLVVSVDRVNNLVTSFLDGITIESEAIMVDSVTGSESLCLGDTTQPMVGNIDEVKLHAVARSADWVLATYRNVHDPASFLQLEPAH